jgi:sigma-70-like protein
VVAAVSLPIYIEPSSELPSRRPLTRADCQPGGPMGVRPCPFSDCRHHVPRAKHHPSRRVGSPLAQSEDSCVLDVVAQHGALNLAEIGRVLALSRERVRQLETRALSSLRSVAASMGLELETMLASAMDRSRG